MYASGDWGDERSAWLIHLAQILGVTLPSLLVLTLLFVFRIQLFRLLDAPLRMTAPFWRVTATIVAMIPPAQKVFSRYLYTGRHLSTA